MFGTERCDLAFQFSETGGQTLGITRTGVRHQSFDLSTCGEFSQSRSEPRLLRLDLAAFNRLLF